MVCGEADDDEGIDAAAAGGRASSPVPMNALLTVFRNTGSPESGAVSGLGRLPGVPG